MANLRRYQPLLTWDPFDIMREMLAEPATRTSVPDTETATFVPRFEVKETKEGYVFKADLPGIEEKDLDINLTGNRLTVSGKREAEVRKEEETFYAYERSYGSFSRSFTLPADVDDTHVEAELKNGVLVLTLPKRPEHQPKKISLKSAAEKILGRDKPKA